MNFFRLIHPPALERVAPRRHPAHLTTMIKRATERPAPFLKPAHWNEAPPPASARAASDSDELSPTRYGDWVKNGIAIDF